MNPILEIRNLVRKFPGVTAVDGLSLTIPSGVCFGLLGPNGAGKTTTIEIAEGIIRPTSGEILYKGKPRGRNFKEEVGIQFQATSLLGHLNVRESLQTFHALYRHPMDMEKVIRLCRLEEILDRPNDKISGGQKQRLLIAMALINDPELLFLDEPTTGLDPQARHHLWEVIEDIKSHGKTLILTTHYMEEAQRLCDEIAIIDKGKIIAQGTPDELLKKYCDTAVIHLPKSDVPHPEMIADFLQDACPNGKCVEVGGDYQFQTDDVNQVVKTLIERGISISHMTIRTPNLEDLFLYLTGRALRQ